MWDTSGTRSKQTLTSVSTAFFFSDAVGVLEDELALTIRDPYSENEVRWITVGMDLVGRLLVVVYMWRGETIRFISARRATPRERQEYQGAGPAWHPSDEEKP
jgi:uncharacterized DUF497 family protein